MDVHTFDRNKYNKFVGSTGTANNNVLKSWHRLCINRIYQNVIHCTTSSTRQIITIAQSAGSSVERESHFKYAMS